MIHFLSIPDLSIDSDRRVENNFNINWCETRWAYCSIWLKSAWSNLVWWIKSGSLSSGHLMSLLNRLRKSQFFISCMGSRMQPGKIEQFWISMLIISGKFLCREKYFQGILILVSVLFEFYRKAVVVKREDACRECKRWWVRIPPGTKFVFHILLYLEWNCLVKNCFVKHI